eukprot:CAMPEP_0172370164 /NCGR_PEP_ID=MMETSP1060-20121228/36716_1 /TAXON_ID=37318 /ORGANISM="Pseudo-nitzschia pungens, Strain cf. cingulata" /LENGTH=547 /DNA_ID=CAMNT_0013095357 /DNA_START=21 /DNA_END=1664 /DNA_ORIENTATION=+
MAAIASTTANNNATGMAEQQVLSWLHDEESLVTSQRIQHHCVFGMDSESESDETERPISRREGSELLRKLFEKDPSKYVATVCTVERFRSVPVAAAVTPNREIETEPIPSNAEEYQTTEFELVTTSDSLPCNGNNGNDKDNNNNNSNSNNPEAPTIMALRSRKATLAESLDAANERDEAFLRDKLFVEGRADWFDNTACLSHIHATNKTTDNRGAGVPIRSGGAGAGAASASAASEPSTRATTSGVEKRSGLVTAAKASAATAVKSKSKSKPTTAGSFFAVKTKPGAVANASKTKPKQTSSSSSSSAKVTKSKPSKTTAKAKAAGTSERDDDDDVEMEDASPIAKVNANASTSIGNADDFVGDEDEDSDDEQDMVDRRIRSAEIVRKLRERDDHMDALAKEDDRDRERVAARVTRGAMDAFCEKRREPANSEATATATEAEEGAPGTKRRRRRKVFRDTTAVNARGFLVTTTEAVWEEIESDDDEEEEETNTAGSASSGKQSQPSKRAPAKPRPKQRQKPIAAKKTKPAAKRDLKQGSLMGFFSKKK